MSEEKYNIDEYPIEKKLEEVMKLNQEQVKIIEDLQQKVEQLEKENKELRDENKRIFQNVNDDELLISNAMNYAELKKAEKKVEQLENIRKEAIEYLKKREYDNYSCSVCSVISDDLLNILNKGDNKDE